MTCEKEDTHKGVKAVVAVGTSTGGPKALLEILPNIPSDFPASIVIVQHMPGGFTKSLAERLNNLCEITVKEAEEGDILQPGWAYIAPGGYHMMFETPGDSNIVIKLSKEPPVNGHRPSVNVMMKSLSDTGIKNVVGVILTGMGKDGSEGIKAIKSKNKGFIIAQDENSSVVYGMPKGAVQTGAVDVVLPLNEIAYEIVKYVGGV